MKLFTAIVKMLEIAPARQSEIAAMFRMPFEDIGMSLIILATRGLTRQMDTTKDPQWALTAAARAGKVTLDLNPPPAPPEEQAMEPKNPTAGGKIAKDHEQFMERMRAQREAWREKHPAPKQPKQK